MSAIRVVVADDHPVVLAGVTSVLEAADDIEVVGTSSTGEGVLRTVDETRADVLLLDLHMPKMDGIAVLRELRGAASSVKVVLLTGAVHEDEMMEALRLGVRGVLLKEMAPRLLIECIKKVNDGDQWLEKHSVAKVVETMLKREEAVQRMGNLLTRRELEIMRLVLKNFTNEQVAEKLCIAAGTVKTHVHSIYEKLGISGRVELARFAQEKGLV